MSAGRSLIVCVGGSGCLYGAFVKAGFVEQHGQVPGNIALLGFDVMAEPPVVMMRRDGGANSPVTLELNVEYLPLGKDLDPPRVSELLRQRPHLRPALHWLLSRQPGGRYARSLERGSEGERSYGLMAFKWSELDVESLVERTLRRLNDMRLGAGDEPRRRGISNVFIVGSEAGGVDSAIALPVAGLIKRAMWRLGLSLQHCLFVYAAVAPEAFPETQLRLSNAYETLADVAVAQREGVIP